MFQLPEIHGDAGGLANVTEEGWAKIRGPGSGQRMGGSGQRLKKWAKGMFVGKGVISLGKEILFII